MKRILTLDEFILQRQKDFKHASGELTALLRDIGVATKIINNAINKAGLLNILGAADQSNTSGDDVQKLDIYSNDLLIDCMKSSGQCAGIASEENEGIIPISGVHDVSSKYVMVTDPLDGSSNIDVNVSVGTIFGIYRRLSDADGPCNVNDFLQKGTELVAAGYVLYGTSTMLVFTTGNGVNGFTLDPSIGEFCLSHPNIRIPQTGNFYSVNQGYYLKFPTGVRRFLSHCFEEKRTLRYIGSMVADVHRTLFKGGIFTYPYTSDKPGGKLRLLYECNPMSFIVEQAGGVAIDCHGNRIMEQEITELHQKTSIAIGSPDIVEEINSFIERFKGQ